MAACFYCFADAKLTRAHLYQQRFREVIEGDSENVYLTSSSAAVQGVSRALRYPGDIRNAHVSSLCGECNSKWMEGIEQDASEPFADLVQGRRIPAPTDGLKLAHWAVIVGALSSELYPTFYLPEAHRREIRNASGLPTGYSTFIVWTSDKLVSLQTDLYRGISTHEAGDAVHWISVIQTGLGVLITATPGVTPRLARLLHEAGIAATLGYIGETLVYVPDGVEETTLGDGRRPTHVEVHDLVPSVLGEVPGLETAPNGVQVLDLSQGVQTTRVDASFDFEGRLFDYRQLGTRQP